MNKNKIIISISVSMFCLALLFIGPVEAFGANYCFIRPISYGDHWGITYNCTNGFSGEYCTNGYEGPPPPFPPPLPLPPPSPPAPPPAPINGSCEAAPGTFILLPSIPTANLCSAGTPSAVSGSGHPWSWTCAGSNGGSTASCSATLLTTPQSTPTQPAVCGSSPHTCSSGNVQDITDTSNRYQWKCHSSDSQSVVSCSAALGGGGVCGNGIVDGSESCDLGTANNGACPKTCSSACTINSCGGGSYCGDGIVNGSESCDLGTANNGTCPRTCSSACTTNSCGEVVTSLNCFVIMNPSYTPNKVNVYTNTTWEATSSLVNLSGRASVWTIVDSNGTTTATSLTNKLINKIFNTEGLKTLSVAIASSTLAGLIYLDCDTTAGVHAIATTTVVLEGGSINEH